MRKILLSLAVIGMVSAVSIGGTVAYLSDTTTVEQNTLATGSVVLGASHNLPFEITNLAPGDEFERDLAIQYEGSLPADLYIGAREESGMDLGPVLEYRIERIADSNWTSNNDWIVGDGSTWKDFSGSDHLLAEYLLTHEGLEEDDWARARLHVRMKAGNEVDFDQIPGVTNWNDYQDIEEQITLILHAVQEGGDAPTEAPRDLNMQITNDDTGATYTRIQTALDEAQDGHTILVPQGTYEEELVVENDDLTLQFDSTYGGVATIQSDTAASEGVIAIMADNVTVKGFTIDNLDENDDDDNRALRVADNTSGTIIADNRFANSRRGIQANWTGTSVGSATIEENVFETRYGLAGTENWNNLFVSNNTFATDTEGIGVGSGVEFIDQNDNTLAEGDDVTWLEDNNDFTGSGTFVADYR